MKIPKRLLLGLVLALGTGALGFRSADTLKDIAPHPGDSSKILVVSENELYLRGEGKEEEKIFFSMDRSSSLERLITHPFLVDQAFLLVKEKILAVDLKKRRSRWIFGETNPRGNRIHAFVFHPEDPQKMYVGTELGLFRSFDGGRTWYPPFRWPENQPVEFVAFSPSPSLLFFLGTNREIFFSKNDGASFESGFSLPLPTGEEEKLEEGEEENFLGFTSLAFSTKNPLHLWIGTQEGVYESRDGGTTWERLSDSGLENPGIIDLVYSEKTSQLIAAAGRGVFRFDPQAKRWESLPLRFTEPPRALTFLSGRKGDEKLLIASGTEVFEWVFQPSEISLSTPSFFPSPAQLELFRKLTALEPTALEVQKQAIRYGQLGNGRIKRWHWASRLRAFIPDVSFGKDFSIGNNIDIDRGGTNTPDQFIEGPAERDKGWDFDVSWELGDFLWSSAQTSIDSRAKLLVELRESILSQVTRIYFERRRLQMEIALSLQAPTFQEHLNRLLRVDELTAQLDAFTGGYFSKELEKIYQTHPDLKSLWEN